MFPGLVPALRLVEHADLLTLCDNLVSENWFMGAPLLAVAGTLVDFSVCPLLAGSEKAGRVNYPCRTILYQSCADGRGKKVETLLSVMTDLPLPGSGADPSPAVRDALESLLDTVCSDETRRAFETEVRSAMAPIVSALGSLSERWRNKNKTRRIVLCSEVIEAE